MKMPTIAPTNVVVIPVATLTQEPSLDLLAVVSEDVAELAEPELDGVNVALSGETVEEGYGLPAALISNAADWA